MLDQALIGLLWGDIQFWRNLLFAVAKLGFLWAIAAWLPSSAGRMLGS